MVTLTSFGAAEETTGSKHLLKIDDENYFIDVGMWQGSRDANQKKS